MRTLIAIPLIALAACSQPRVEIVKPPVSLTHCQDEPTAPDLPRVDWSSVEVAQPMQLIRDQMMLGYVLSLRSAWGDCSAKVEGVKAWSEGL